MNIVLCSKQFITFDYDVCAYPHKYNDYKTIFVRKKFNFIDFISINCGDDIMMLMTDVCTYYCST